MLQQKNAGTNPPYAKDKANWSMMILICHFGFNDFLVHTVYGSTCALSPWSKGAIFEFQFLTIILEVYGMAEIFRHERTLWQPLLICHLSLALVRVFYRIDPPF